MRIIIIVGPTAVGKTEYTIKIAKELDGEIVSCDSMQLYKYMDIGSAKPSKLEMSEVKHYLVDEIDPRDDFSAAEYQKRAKTAIKTIFEKGKIPIISGGTGLYVNSLIYDMDFGISPAKKEYRKELEMFAKEHGNEALHKKLALADLAAAERIHPNNTKKIIRAMEAVEFSGTGIKPFSEIPKTTDYSVTMIGLTRDRNELYERINKRVDILIKKGLVEEVRSLLDMGLTESNISMKGIGYKEIIDCLNGKYDLERAIELVKQNTRRYAKRQLTWFRRYDDIKWFDLSEKKSEDSALKEILEWLKRNR